MNLVSTLSSVSLAMRVYALGPEDVDVFRPKKWGMTLKSGYLSGSTNNLACNDIHPALQAAWGKLPKVGKIGKQLDLARGVKYQTCGKK